VIARCEGGELGRRGSELGVNAFARDACSFRGFGGNRIRHMDQDYSITVTYDHRLERIGHPVRSAIHKLQVPMAITFNRANRHSVEFKPLAALKDDLGVKRR
jgi:hypothetical protein